MSEQPPADPAKSRFLVLQLLRLGGIVTMMLAAAIWHGDLIRPGGVPRAGAILLAIGLIEALVIPRYLARRWRSQQP